jgi:hypothetical protein
VRIYAARMRSLPAALTDLTAPSITATGDGTTITVP